MLNTKKSVHNVKYKLNEKKITQLPMQCSYLESHFIDERRCQMQRQQNKFEFKSLLTQKTFDELRTNLSKQTFMFQSV